MQTVTSGWALQVKLKVVGQVSVFSDLNQLNDISMKSPYAALCGVLPESSLETFLPELERLARKRRGVSLQEVIDLMECQYTGYHFHPEGVLLFFPFSVFECIRCRKSNWVTIGFQTGFRLVHSEC